MNKKAVAKLENDFIVNAHYNLSAVEQKIVLFLASRLNPKSDKEFVQQIIPIKEIENFIWEKNKVGNVYEYLHIVCTRLLNRTIFFPKGAIINGEKIYGGGIHWFQSILVKDTDKGLSIEFMFSERMKPFLLELNQYVRLNVVEVMNMKGKHAIRMYQVFKAEREKTKKFRSITLVSYSLDELKTILNLSGRYKVLKDFRRNVLEPIEREINEYSEEISISYEYLKTRRKVTGVEFYIFDKKNIDIKKELESYEPSKKEIESLSRSKLHAYENMLSFGIYEGIAFKQMLPNIKGGNIEGYEDLFLEKAIAHFAKRARQQKTSKESAATFVNWWTAKKVFSHDEDVFWKIAEEVNLVKKKMSQEKLDNRSIAKGMTNKEFENWYSKRAPKE